MRFPEVKEVCPVPPFGTVSAFVRLSVLIEAVPVAVSVANERFPERSSLPWTESTCEGEVVPTPMLPDVVSVPA